MVRILSSFLTGRKIQVSVKGKVSEEVPLNAGTPQGSVLSPLLFILYVNDIPVKAANKTNISQFADDMGIWTHARSEKAIELRLSKALSELELWCSKWRIKLNALKTQLLVFRAPGRKKALRKINLELFNTNIVESDQAKLLGMTITKTMSFKQHINETVKKAHRRLHLLYRLSREKWGANTNTLLKLYKSYVRPILEFGAPVTLFTGKANLRLMQQVQNRALRIALKCSRYTKISELHEKTNMMSITDRLKRLTANTVESLKQHSELFRDMMLQRKLLWKAEPKPSAYSSPSTW